ncbi:hypothetical protein [Marinicrinis sediminis]|uniref:RnfABCDGE type electron transport complex subunit D n=1 Tax=Marinicrinis sediminis TaxID=1652465 RepID=A0ABW5RF97_9BACL
MKSWNGKQIDPRYFILLFLFTFVLTGQLFLDFFQKWDAFFAAIGTAMAVEFVLSGLIHKSWKFPLSALISGMGISLILSSFLIWPYVLASVLAISAKYMFRLGGRHVFNPNNVAVVCVLFFLPQYVVSTPKQWTNDIQVMILMLVLGAIAAWSANRLDTVAAFVASFSVFAWMRHIWADEPIYYSMGPMMGASFQLFVFFMLTDPKTTPSSPYARVWIAVCIAGVDALLRVYGVTNSLFYAAFIITVLIGIPYRWYMTRERTLPSA